MLAPWKKSYDQPRQHIKKQRHYFANKGPSSQGYGFSSSHMWMWELDYKESWVPKNWRFWTVVLEKTWESLGLQVDSTSPILRKAVLNIHWKDWYWSWNSKILVTSCEELTDWKRPRCWERFKAGEGDNRGWDGWMTSLTQWTWVWVNSRSWWWTGRPGMLRFMGSQRVEHDWGTTELNWTDGIKCHDLSFLSFKPAFLFSFFTFIKRLFHSSSLSAVRVVSCICHVYCLAFMIVFHCFRKWKITMPRDTWCAADCTPKAATLPAHASPERVGASHVPPGLWDPRKRHLCVPTTSTVKPPVNT